MYFFSEVKYFCYVGPHRPARRGDARAHPVGHPGGSDRLRLVLPEARYHHYVEEHVLRWRHRQLAVQGKASTFTVYDRREVLLILIGLQIVYHEPVSLDQ